MSQDILGGSLPDDDEIDRDKTDKFKPWLPQIVDTDVLSHIKLSSDEDLQVRLCDLCKKYKNIFSNELPAAQKKFQNFLEQYKLRSGKSPDIGLSHAPNLQ